MMFFAERRLLHLAELSPKETLTGSLEANEAQVQNKFAHLKDTVKRYDDVIARCRKIGDDDSQTVLNDSVKRMQGLIHNEEGEDGKFERTLRVHLDHFLKSVVMMEREANPENENEEVYHLYLPPELSEPKVVCDPKIPGADARYLKMGDNVLSVGGTEYKLGTIEATSQKGHFIFRKPKNNFEYYASGRKDTLGRTRVEYFSDARVVDSAEQAREQRLAQVQKDAKAVINECTDLPFYHEVQAMDAKAAEQYLMKGENVRGKMVALLSRLSALSQYPTAASSYLADTEKTVENYLNGHLERMDVARVSPKAKEIDDAVAKIAVPAGDMKDMNKAAAEEYLEKNATCQATIDDALIQMDGYQNPIGPQTTPHISWRNGVKTAFKKYKEDLKKMRMEARMIAEPEKVTEDAIASIKKLGYEISAYTESPHQGEYWMSVNKNGVPFVSDIQKDFIEQCAEMAGMKAKAHVDGSWTRALFLSDHSVTKLVQFAELLSHPIEHDPNGHEARLLSAVGRAIESRVKSKIKVFHWGDKRGAMLAQTIEYLQMSGNNLGAHIDFHSGNLIEDFPKAGEEPRILRWNFKSALLLNSESALKELVAIKSDGMKEAQKREFTGLQKSLGGTLAEFGRMSVAKPVPPENLAAHLTEREKENYWGKVYASCKYIYHERYIGLIRMAGQEKDKKLQKEMRVAYKSLGGIFTFLFDAWKNADTADKQKEVLGQVKDRFNTIKPPDFQEANAREQVVIAVCDVLETGLNVADNAMKTVVQVVPGGSTVYAVVRNTTGLLAGEEEEVLGGGKARRQKVLTDAILDTADSILPVVSKADGILKAAFKETAMGNAKVFLKDLFYRAIYLDQDAEQIFAAYKAMITENPQDSIMAVLQTFVMKVAQKTVVQKLRQALGEGVDSFKAAVQNAEVEQAVGDLLENLKSKINT